MQNSSHPKIKHKGHFTCMERGNNTYPPKLYSPIAIKCKPLLQRTPSKRAATVHDTNAKKSHCGLTRELVAIAPRARIQPSYRDVNPSCYSNQALHAILESIRDFSNTFEFNCAVDQNARVVVTGLLCAEEVSLLVSISQHEGKFKLDFSRLHGDEGNFLRLCDMIQYFSSAIEANPLLGGRANEWFDVDSTTQGNLQHALDADLFVDCCEDFLDDFGWTDAAEVSSSIKCASLPLANRIKIQASPRLSSILVATLQKMIQSPSPDIARTGVFVLSLFDTSPTFLASLGDSVAKVVQYMTANEAIPRMRRIARLAESILNSATAAASGYA
ncbi:Aste57867_24670 [Aphanomyces stellatus]|uniref:Aste57867_24670 protein n=1 Tax=Aphanomyces stellatus TaxID=120398 RepID=A0A485LVB3_9STRA|nr:hypothetical protein As57867_024592 [Aphanomyces stellatus]VFU01307.1 Aste57867_24670 [Aphanomyces stellatus]